MRRSVSVVVIDRANLGRLQPLLEEFRKSDLFDLSVVCGGSTLVSGVADSLESQGYKVHRVSHVVSGDGLHETALSVGLGEILYSHAFNALRPDYTVLIGDRSEAFAAATAARYSGSQLVHLQGGETSSTNDQWHRWCISFMSHWHVPATPEAANALMRAGISRENILAVGCPSVDLVQAAPQTGEVLACLHANTLHCETSRQEAEEFFAAVPSGATVLSTNGDAGRDAIVDVCRAYGFVQVSLTPEEFSRRLAGCAVAVGNSSGFVRDSAHTGAPVVLVGDRQDGRECGDNVMRVVCERQAIRDAIEWQISHGRYPASDLYGKPGISERIVAALANLGRAAA